MSGMEEGGKERSIVGGGAGRFTWRCDGLRAGEAGEEDLSDVGGEEQRKRTTIPRRRGEDDAGYPRRPSPVLSAERPYPPGAGTEGDGGGSSEGVGLRCSQSFPLPPPPPYLPLVACLLILWATPSLGGICWTSMARSGHCTDLMSQRMGREECCSAGGASTSWSAKDMDPGAIFFWRVRAGGVPCQACKENCTGVVCAEGKRCVMRKGRPKCTCAPDCRHVKGANGRQRGPVCGSDGRSYRSACRLRKRSCRKKNFNLSIAYYGLCQRSCDKIRCPDGKQCLLDQRLTPHCVKCRHNCVQAPFSRSSNLLASTSSPSAPSAAALAASATARHRKVCGVDGVTYRSACHLREAACRRGEAIPMAYKGRCKKSATCRSVHCREGQSCLTEPLTGRPRCVTCSQRCPRNNRRTTNAPSHNNSTRLSHETNIANAPKKSNDYYRGWSSWGPLCGSNDQTYDSWCHMLKDSCATGFVISIKHPGSCESAEGSMMPVSEELQQYLYSW